MSDCIVAKAVFDWRNTQKQLDELTQLMKDAFVVFDYESAWCCKLPDIPNVIEQFWVKFTKYPIEFHTSDYNIIWEASVKVSKAFITRKDFNELLAPHRVVIENYASTLATVVESKRQHIIELYDNFEPFTTSEHDFIFEQEKIKEVFMQFIMS